MINVILMFISALVFALAMFAASRLDTQTLIDAKLVDVCETGAEKFL
jgi:hypothetical protein